MNLQDISDMAWTLIISINKGFRKLVEEKEGDLSQSDQNVLETWHLIQMCRSRSKRHYRMKELEKSEISMQK